ncbi:MAG: clpA, partial [Polaromonas sp.]|nr:clpA [Polaromonas sp.]
LEQQLAEKKVEVTFTDNLRKHLAKKGFDPLMGARPMQRLIQDTIRRALADELLFGRLTEGGRLTVDIELKTDEKGAETMNKATIGFTNPREAGDEMADIKRLFTPEFRNRLDAVVSFKALDEVVILRVVDKFLLQLETQLAEKKVEVTFTDKLRKYLGKKGFDPLMGARPMQRLIQDTIRRALADELLFGRLTDGGRLTVDMKVTTDEKGVETGEVELDIQPLAKREGRAKPESEAAEAS